MNLGSRRIMKGEWVKASRVKCDLNCKKKERKPNEKKTEHGKNRVE